MIADIHAHLDLYKENEVERVIENARKNNVKAIITNSVDLASCRKNLEYSKKYPDIVKLAVGFYPQDALSREEKEMWKKEEKPKEKFEELRDFALKNKNYVFAIGEVGMDLKNGKDVAGQEKLLRQELELAQELKVPAIIHSRKAEKEVVDIVKDYNCVRIMHCFSGSFGLIKKALDYGCYFSIPTNIVKLEHFQKMAKELPREKILTETDAPFLSPFVGVKNEPAFIKETIKIIAKIWNLSEEETEKILWENFCQAFSYGK